MRRIVLTGALVGALLTASLIALFFLAHRIAGLPFPPFDVLDWMGKVLPGSLVISTIESMVTIIRAFNLGSTDTTAKLAEQMMGVVGMWLTGIVAGAVLFAVRHRYAQAIRSRYLPGLLLGMLIGLPVAMISEQVNESASTSSLVNFIWIMLGFLAWGIGLSRVYDELSAMPAASPASEAPASTSVELLNRRQFLVRLGGATATITVIGAGLGALLRTETVEPISPTSAAGGEPVSQRWSENNSLPNANAAVQPAPGTRPEFTPLEDHYRIDINALPPVVKEEEWSLSITGLVENPLVLTLTDLRNNYEPLHQFVTLACISNPIAGDLISTTRWTGVSLKRLIEEVHPQGIAGHYLKITSADDFFEYVSLEEINNDERIMLTYAWDGEPLLTRHGFPLRIYLPDRYGMKQPKWIVAIEVVDHWEEGYWVQRGWDEIAQMRATSVIDTVSLSDLIEDGDTTLLPVGGIAHAGDRSISKVEVQVDGGEWVEAQLRDPISDTTWVIWRYDWPFEEGDHSFVVRCVDGEGNPQIERVQGTAPSGATGLHRRTI